jgi:uncharacterized protein (TIGR02145 family)
MIKIFLVSALSLIWNIMLGQPTNSFTDTRDGEVYAIIKIVNSADQTTTTWMAQNIRYETSDSWAYENNIKYLKDFGRLYKWEAAIKACPKGWHLPSDEEWTTLVNFFGGEEKAGTALKSTKGWEENGNGTNSSRFNALPGGSRHVNYVYRSLGVNGFWWSSTEMVGDVVWFRFISSFSSNVNRDNCGKTNGLSVRCVKD